MNDPKSQTEDGVFELNLMRQQSIPYILAQKHPLLRLLNVFKFNTEFLKNLFYITYI